MARYVDAVVAEIDAARDAALMTVPSTVYLGGGTPSIVPGPLLRRVIARLDVPRGTEITVEANPESTTDELLGELAAAGATRISLGVQSTSRAALAGLGRHATPGSVETAVRRLAVWGFAEYGVDLVYGAAGESDDSWRATLTDVLALSPPPVHVSVYALTVEPGTPLAKDPRRHPDDDTLARRYGIADEVLTAAGFGWYEISNFARPGHESRHNAHYWDRGSYLGFGASAHSHLDGWRFRNVWHIDRYLERLEAGRPPLASEEHLSDAQRRFESLLLSLRTRRGVPLESLALEGIEHLVTVEGARAVLTREGRMLADEVARRLVDR
jgi:oxygen-independent coproporphyrinogen-3 oxidase